MVLKKILCPVCGKLIKTWRSGMRRAKNRPDIRPEYTEAHINKEGGICEGGMKKLDN
jgi:hypothetical protein